MHSAVSTHVVRNKYVCPSLLSVFVHGVMHQLNGFASADPLPPHLMYYQVKSANGKVRWIAIRGTSKLEGLHKHFNKLLTCGNIGCELAGVLICHWSGRWNIDRGIQNKGDVDYGMYDHRWDGP